MHDKLNAVEADITTLTVDAAMMLCKSDFMAYLPTYRISVSKPMANPCLSTAL